MKQFAKKSLVLFIALFFTATLSAKTPKYIFYCIGDGMSFAHVMATQLFYENGNYEDGNESLVSSISLSVPPSEPMPTIVSSLALLPQAQHWLPAIKLI